MDDNERKKDIKNSLYAWDFIIWKVQMESQKF